MLKKRIVGVIPIRNGIAVQSFRYNSYLPLGDPLIIAENLDRWGIDEILLHNIDRTKKKLGPDIILLERITKFKISTPIIYSGGISSLKDAIHVIQAGADRICLDSLIINDIDEVKKISNKIGSQALIASLPLNIMNNSLFYFNYISSQSIKAMPLIKSILTKNIISEFFVTDYKHEGLVDTFDENIITLLSNIEIPLILFGGITSPKFIKSALSMKNISAIAIGNMLNYKEHSLQTLRKNINSNKLRKSTYSGKIDI